MVQSFHLFCIFKLRYRSTNGSHRSGDAVRSADMIGPYNSSIHSTLSFHRVMASVDRYWSSKPTPSVGHRARLVLEVEPVPTGSHSGPDLRNRFNWNYTSHCDILKIYFVFLFSNFFCKILRDLNYETALPPTSACCLININFENLLFWHLKVAAPIFFIFYTNQIHEKDSRHKSFWKIEIRNSKISSRNYATGIIH